jgi:hypothetical protein
VMPRPLPPWLHDMIAKPPKTGDGVHNWLYRVPRHLHAHLPAGQIVDLLERAVANCGRHVPRSEIIAAVQNSLASAWQPHGASAPIRQTSAGKWPALNEVQRTATLKEGLGLADLWESSPVRFEDDAQYAEEILEKLFPGNPLLCCGRSKSEFDTRPLQDWRGELRSLQLIVPSPMTARTGLTKEGKESAHALSNTGSRRFLVCEFDKGTTDEHATLLLHLAGYAPLVCVVHSGGKSLHGWFYVADQPDAKVLRFFRYAVALGADHATWTRSQFVRMPDGKRDNGRQQPVFFLNVRPLRGQP